MSAMARASGFAVAPVVGLFGDLMREVALPERAAARAGAAAWLDAAAVDTYDARGFNRAGVHRETGSRLDPDGYDVFGYDVRGFDVQGVHRATHTAFDEEGFDRTGVDACGYDRAGRDADGYDRAGLDMWGRDRYGRDAQGCDARGFGRDGTHRDTGTPWAPDGYDSHGRDARGVYRWRKARG